MENHKVYLSKSGLNYRVICGGVPVSKDFVTPELALNAAACFRLPEPISARMWDGDKGEFIDRNI